MESQFKYCPIAWMFHSRRTNNKINKLYERTLRIVYEDDLSTFDQLLAMDKSSVLTIKYQKWYFWEQFETIIRRESTINLRSNLEFVILSINSYLKGKNSLRYFGSVIWNSLVIEIREDHSILSFLTKIN